MEHIKEYSHQEYLEDSIIVTGLQYQAKISDIKNKRYKERGRFGRIVRTYIKKKLSWETLKT
jgi:hypothetical protein